MSHELGRILRDLYRVSKGALLTISASALYGWADHIHGMCWPGHRGFQAFRLPLFFLVADVSFYFLRAELFSKESAGAKTQQCPPKGANAHTHTHTHTQAYMLYCAAAGEEATSVGKGQPTEGWRQSAACGKAQVGDKVGGSGR